MKGPGGYEEEVQEKKDYQNILRGNRRTSSILSGLLSAGQVSATAGDIAGGGVTTKVDGIDTEVALDPDGWSRVFGAKIPSSQYSSIPQAKPSFGRAFEQTDWSGTLDSILDFFNKRKGTEYEGIFGKGHYRGVK